MKTVACTIPAYKMSGDDPMSWGAWLENAQQVQDSLDEPVNYFCAIETDKRGLEPFGPLLARLEQVGGTYWTFSIDDGTETITTPTRLLRIVTGHNFCGYYAIETGSSHCLFLASDVRAPNDILPRLLELEVDCAASHITTYCLDGPRSARFPQWDVREQEVETCAAMMLSRRAFLQLKWRYDTDAGTTDDPSMCRDIREFLGEKVYSRHDCISVHYPEQVPGIEHRHTDEQRKVHR